MHRFSTGQVRKAFDELVQDSFGIDPDEMPRPGESIPDHLKRCDIWPECDFGDFVFRCEKVFGPVASTEEWRTFFGYGVAAAEWERTVAPGLTYDRLAEFVADRVCAVSFDPIEIAGSRCGPAGAFVGLRETVGRLFPDRERFAPSTGVLSHLKRSQVEALWRRLDWSCDRPVPPLRRCRSDALFGGVFLWVVGMGMPAAACLCSGLPDLAAVFMVFGAALLLPYVALRAAENPLPEGVETFGDLARRLADADIPAAAG